MDGFSFSKFGQDPQASNALPFRDPNQPLLPQVGIGQGVTPKTLAPWNAAGPTPGSFTTQPIQTQEQANQSFLKRPNRTEFFSQYANELKQNEGLTGENLDENGEPKKESGFAGTVRSLASVLEPLTLPQDILFSVIGGSLDKEKTIWGNLKDMDWAAYAPGGAAPKRVVDGADLMKLFGVEDERTARIAGIALDFLADPLLLGGALTAIGKVGKVAKLVELGTKIDKAMTARGVFNGITGLGKEGATGNALGKLYIDHSERLINAYRNPYGKVLGINSYKVKGFIDNTLPKATAAKAALGQFGVDVFKKIGLGEQKALDVYEETVDSISELNNKIFGKESKSWLQKGFKIIEGAGDLEKNLADIPTILRTVIFKEAYELAGRRGILLDEGASKIDDAFVNILPPQTIAEGANDLLESTNRVKQLGQKYGISEELVGAKFKELVTGLTHIDARLGLHVSGYEFVKAKFMEAVVNNGEGLDVADKVWKEVLRRGVYGDDVTTLDFYDIVSTVKTAGNSRRGQGGVFVKDAVEKSVYKGNLGASETNVKKLTIGQVLEGVETFSVLPINTYLKNLKAGHMRRAFGVFTDPKDVDAYISNLNNGKIVVGNIIDELNLVDVLGKDREDIAKYVREYQTALKSTSTKGKTGGKTGIMMTQAEIAKHLIESQMRDGVEKSVAVKRARDSMLDIHAASSSGLGWRVSQLQNLKVNKASNPLGGSLGGIGTPGASTFGSQLDTEIDESTLQILGEFAHPLISIFEQAGAAKQAIAPKEFLRQLYEIAKKDYIKIDEGAGHVDKFGTEFVKVPGNEKFFGAFAGKMVHPYLYDQMVKGAGSTNRHIPLQHLRSMITGGYLASPNVVTANFGGGMYSAAAAGINPVRMTRALAKTWPELRGYEGAATQWKARLKKHINVSGGSVVTQDATAEFKKLKLEEAGMDGGIFDIKGMMTKFTKFFDDQLKAPITGNPKYSGWAGLTGFQFVENWFKVAAFQTETERFMSLGDDVLKAEQKAAEMARTIVFDYSELPDSLKMLRDYGLLMFPGYPYFLAGRTLGALADRPAVLAQADKISEGMTNLFLDEEEKYAFYANMPQYLKDDQGTPFEVSVNESGDKVVRTIPLSQIIPTNGFQGGAFAESLAAGGVWRPFMEILSAVVSGNGEQTSSKYGLNVFTPESKGLGTVSEIAQFMYASLAPSALKKIYTPVAGGPDKGLIPSLSLPKNLGDTLYSYSEITKGRADRTFKDELLSTLLRSPSRVALSGPLAAGEYKSARYDHDQKMGGLRDRYLRFLSEGNNPKAEGIAEEMRKMNSEFAKKWTELLEYSQGSRKN